MLIWLDSAIFTSNLATSERSHHPAASPSEQRSTIVLSFCGSRGIRSQKKKKMPREKKAPSLWCTGALFSFERNPWRLDRRLQATKRQERAHVLEPPPPVS